MRSNVARALSGVAPYKRGDAENVTIESVSTPRSTRATFAKAAREQAREYEQQHRERDLCRRQHAAKTRHAVRAERLRRVPLHRETRIRARDLSGGRGAEQQHRKERRRSREQ
jgi:hypothetical protein